MKRKHKRKQSTKLLQESSDVSCFRTCSWTKARMAAILSRYTGTHGKGKEPVHWSSSCWLRNPKFSLGEAMMCCKSNTELHKKQNIHPNSLHVDEMQWEIVVTGLTEWVSKISMLYHKGTLGISRWLLKKGMDRRCTKGKGCKGEARTEMQTVQHHTKLSKKGLRKINQHLWSWFCISIILLLSLPVYVLISRMPVNSLPH